MGRNAVAVLLAAAIACGGGTSGPPVVDDQPDDEGVVETTATDAADEEATPPDGDDAGDATQPDVAGEVVPDAPAEVEPEPEVAEATDTEDPGAGDGTDADAPEPDAPVADEGVAEAGPLTAAQCFADQLPASGVPPIDYDQFDPVIGSHCNGTNYQDIKGIQRVVFAGDSITTGTPPTATVDWYRNKLAKTFAQKWGLEAPGFMWMNTDLLGSGMTLQMRDGEFWCCAKFGARTDDLYLEPHKQFVTCNPPEERNKTTLIVMTIGGNDIFAWAQDMVKGVAVEQLWLDAQKAVKDLEDAIHWVKDDPALFPNGVYVVFANTNEFSDLDSGKDLADCTGAGIISMNTALIDPEFQAMSRYFTTEYMRIAVETGTDMIFFGEHACGHGYMKDDPNGRCYRGEGAEMWPDITCMHPGKAGHQGLYDLFLSVIEE
jgi:hypothetical protein